MTEMGVAGRIKLNMKRAAGLCFVENVMVIAS
jgi:hypothetical protein